MTKKVVIIGAGFAGLQIARKLNNKKNFEVVLIDRFNYHQFQPLYYQVATGGLDASNISFPLRKLFQESQNVRIRLDRVLEIRPHIQTIITEHESIDYDLLLIATGAETNFFGNELLEATAFPMKTTVEALQLRNQIFGNFEQYLYTHDAISKSRILNIVIAGGGPTGVELSGALAEMKRFVLPKDYPEIDFSNMQIILLEGGDRLLAAMSRKSSEKSKKYLEELGVTVRTQTLLKQFDGKTVTLNDGTTIESSLVIWAAGIKGNIPDGINPTHIVKGNRIQVDRFNQVLGLPQIYALGDVAYMETPLYPNGLPQVANVAINQAANFATNLLKHGEQLYKWHPYEYLDLGSMATVGRNKAVVDLPSPGLHFGGFFAWLIWMFLHLMLLLGVKNKLFVLINWLYNYVTYDQSLRLIFKEFNRQGQQASQNTSYATNPVVKP